MIRPCTILRLRDDDLALKAAAAAKADREPRPVGGEDGGPHPRVVVVPAGLGVMDLERGRGSETGRIRGWPVPSNFQGAKERGDSQVN